MYPYYKKDMENGSLSEESALELLTCLWIKTLTVNKVRSQAHALSSAGTPPCIRMLQSVDRQPIKKMQ